MSKEYVRDFQGRILGSYETKSNGDIIVRDFQGRILGKYDKMYNVTRDFQGRVMSKGNAVGMLINK